MKKLLYSAFALSALFLSSCDDEDGFYNEKYVDIPNLVTIQAQDVYEVGESIHIMADINRFQDEPGFATPLDLYRTTSGATGFVFSYTVEREVSAGVWQAVVTTAQEMDVMQGSVQAGSFVLATAAYTSGVESYQFDAGFPLNVAGNYRISFGVNSDSTNEIELRSKTLNDKLFLNIISDTSQLNSLGYYEFTVTD